MSKFLLTGKELGWSCFSEVCFHSCFLRQPSISSISGCSHNADTPPECNPAQTLSSTDEDTVSLAKRKGPLPPLPPHAKADMKLHQSGSVQTSDSTIHTLSWVPPPPAYTAPKPPLSSALLKKSASFAPVSTYILQ